MASSSKRKSPTETATTENESAKKQQISFKPSFDNLAFLNFADCDLDFLITPDRLTGVPYCDQGFANCWSGARGSIGITGGKYCFGCKIVKELTVTRDNIPHNQQHGSRVGISTVDDPIGKLGETKHSYGYDGTGKYLSDGRITVDYGESFGINDVIICSVDMESKPLAHVKFSKNGKQFSAMEFNSPDGKLLRASALFPHVLLKNTEVKLQFSMEHGLVPEEEYKPWASALNDGNAILGPDFSKDCEVIMMVGLPGCGKTTWAEQWVKKHPEKRYILLGREMVLDKMKIVASSQKTKDSEYLKHHGNYVFTTLLKRASVVHRNYVIDSILVSKGFRVVPLTRFASFHKL